MFFSVVSPGTQKNMITTWYVKDAKHQAMENQGGEGWKSGAGA